MSPSYRDDRDAALARADALQRQNDALRTENFWLRARLDPDERDGGIAQYIRSAMAALTVLLAATVLASLVVREAVPHVAESALGEVSTSAELPDAPITDEAVRRALAGAAYVGRAPVTTTPVAAQPVVAPHDDTASGVALTPLLQGCFQHTRGRVDLLATVSARGRAERVYVFGRGTPVRALRGERRCVRRALDAVTLPTAHGDFASYGPNAELHLMLLPAQPLRRHRG